MSDPVESTPSCLRCGYDLRGLDPASHCPECGLSVSFTLNPPATLCAAPPAWVRTLAIGAALFLLSVILIPAAPILLDTLHPYDRTAPFEPQLRHRHQVYAAVFAFHALATWVLTVREPRRTPRPPVRHRLATWVTRAGTLGPIVVVALLLWPPALAMLYRFGQWPALFLLPYAPVPALLFLHLRRLSARLGRPRLAEHAGIVGIGLSACLAAFLAMMLLPAAEKMSPIFVIVPVACFLLFYLWALFLLLRLTVAFARAVTEARATWTHVDAAATTSPATPASTPH